MEQSTKIKCRGIIVCEGKLLVVRHPKDPSFAALPGGRLEAGEDPKSCLVRELKEELGVKAQVGKLLYVNTFTDFEGESFIEFLFEILNPSDFTNFEVNHRTHAYELSEVAWIAPDEGVKILPEQVGLDFQASSFPAQEVKFIK